MMNRLNSGFYSHVNIYQHTSVEVTEAQACLLGLQEPMRLILMLRIMFELQQEPMRFVLLCQASSVELLFLFTDQVSKW